MKNVKEVIDIIINSNMYCILNFEDDGKFGNWLSRGIIFKEKYLKLNNNCFPIIWTQKKFSKNCMIDRIKFFEINYIKIKRKFC